MASNGGDPMMENDHNEDKELIDEPEDNANYKRNNRLVNWSTLIVIIAFIYYQVYYADHFEKKTSNNGQSTKPTIDLKRYLETDRDKLQFLAKYDEFIDGNRFREVNCTDGGYHNEETWGGAPEKCGTIFSDTLVNEEEAKLLRTLTKRMVEKVGYQSEDFEESKNIRRVRLYECFVYGGQKGIFDQKDYELLNETSFRVKTVVSQTFGVPMDKLFFAPMCEMTRFRPVTAYREFRHIDKVRSQPLIVTSIIWLSTLGEDFEGGCTEFLTGGPDPFTPLIIEPKLGRFGAWTSGYENPHGVLELESGERHALLFGFTSDSKEGYKTLDDLHAHYMRTLRV